MASRHFNQHRHHSTEQLFRLFDLFVIAITLIISMLIYGINFSSHNFSHYIFAAITAMLCFLLISEMTSIYHFEPGQITKRRSGWVIITSFFTFVCLLILAYLTKTTAEYSRIVISSWFFLMTASLVVWRYIACKLMVQYFKKHPNNKNVAILGSNEVGQKIAEHIKDNLAMGYNFVGFFDDRSSSDNRINDKYKDQILGNFNDVVCCAQNRDIDVLYITLPMAAEKRIIALLDELADSAIAVHIIPNFFMYNILHAKWHTIGDYQALSIYDTPFYGAGSLIKKIEDISIASIIVTLISIPMILIALAIKLTSPGPVIFKQKRYGINGKELIVYKFRTMNCCDDGKVIKQAEKNDNRITKLGSFLRKTSLDELPQFFNVLNGSMSIVGPRPHAVAHNEEYRKKIDGYMLRHLVKPGITGWAQINGFRGETQNLEQMEKRIEYDLNYIRNWSLMWDIKIIFLTIFKGFINKNAY